MIGASACQRRHPIDRFLNLFFIFVLKKINKQQSQFTSQSIEIFYNIFVGTITNESFFFFSQFCYHNIIDNANNFLKFNNFMF